MVNLGIFDVLRSEIIWISDTFVIDGAVYFFIGVKVGYALLHFELELIGKEQDGEEPSHSDPKIPSPLTRSDSHVLPDVVAWLHGFFNFNLFPEDLDFSSIYDFNGVTDVLVGLEGDEDATDE